MIFCKPGQHKFYRKRIPPKTDPHIISIIGCKKCEFEVFISNKLSEKDKEWAKKVAERLKN